MRERLPAKRQSKEAVRSAQREWLGQVRERTGRSLTQLARDAGLSNSTLTRFFNRENYDGTLDPTAVQHLSEITGIPGPGITLEAQAPGFREEGDSYRTEDGHASVVELMLADRPQAFAMTMRSDVLLGANVRAGDVLIFDPAETPRDGDIVCAQIHKRTAFRVFQSPYLLPATAGAGAPRPEVIGGKEVSIIGVMINLIRLRR